jgi:hypothetical protein
MTTTLGTFSGHLRDAPDNRGNSLWQAKDALQGALVMTALTDTFLLSHISHVELTLSTTSPISTYVRLFIFRDNYCKLITGVERRLPPSMLT